jgi:V-type H+-transporting ATPase subunit D
LTLISSFQVSNKKQRDTAAADAELAERMKREGSNKENDEGPESSDVLGDQEDADVIF